MFGEFVNSLTTNIPCNTNTKLYIFSLSTLRQQPPGPGPVFLKLAETKFCLKSQVLVSNLRLFLVSNLLPIHKIVETKFSLRFGLKLKTGT